MVRRDLPWAHWDEGAGECLAITQDWLLCISDSAQGFILGVRLALCALLGAVPVGDSGSAQSDHCPGDSSTNNGQTAAACDFHLLPLNFVNKNETNPHLSLPLAYQVLCFLSPLLLKQCPFHFTVILYTRDARAGVRSMLGTQGFVLQNSSVPELFSNAVQSVQLKA